MTTTDKGTDPRNPEDVRIGETLSYFRDRFGYTQDQLATETGVSRSHIANIEAGRKHLSDRHLALIAKALELRPLAIKRPDINGLALAA